MKCGIIGTVTVVGHELSRQALTPQITLCSCIQCLGGVVASSLRWCRFLFLHGQRLALGNKSDSSYIEATPSYAQGLLPAWS